MLNVNENVNLYGNISIKKDGQDITVMNVNANISREGNNFSMNFNVVNNDILQTNKKDVQTQINTFLETLRNKMSELGYDVTI